MAVIERTKKSRKISMKKRMEGGGIVYCLSKYDNAFSQGLLDEITELYNKGHRVEDIAETFEREALEILIGLLHQASLEKVTRPFAGRLA